MIENCEIYVTQVRYKNSSWEDNPDVLLQNIYDNLSEINKFYFITLVINMAQVYNVGLKESHYDSMIIYIKGIKFRHKEFLDLKDVRELETQLREQLNYIDDLYFEDIEIRSTKNFSDYELGLLNFEKHSNTPYIVETH